MRRGASLLRLLVVVMGAGLLSACTWLWTPEATLPGSAEREKLRTVSVWFMDGRVKVQTPDDSWTAGLEWRHADPEDRLLLSGPLGQHVAGIVRNGDGMVIETAQGNRVESSDPDGLMLEQLGFSVPLDALRYWVLALPAPQQAFAARVAAENPATLLGFEQAGWSLGYDSFMQEGRWVVPRKMTVRGRNGVVLTLIVDRWRFDE